MHRSNPIFLRQAAAQPPPEPCARRHPRMGLYLPCEIRQGLHPWRRLTLCDISRDGLSATGLAEFDPREAVRLRLPGLNLLHARLVWQAGRRWGFQLVQPLHELVLADYITRHGGG